jgi:hypothetical protein
MPDPIHIGSEVPAGTYRCTNCSYELDLGADKHLPPCPKCSGPQEWKATTGANDELSVREQSGAETTEGNDATSILRGYDKRLEDWLGSLKDEAGQRSPEVLGGLAAKARDVADYLDSLAESARTKMSSDGPERSSDDDD